MFVLLRFLFNFLLLQSFGSETAVQMFKLFFLLCSENDFTHISVRSPLYLNTNGKMVSGFGDWLVLIFFWSVQSWLEWEQQSRNTLMMTCNGSSGFGCSYFLFFSYCCVAFFFPFFLLNIFVTLYCCNIV